MLSSAQQLFQYLQAYHQGQVAEDVLWQQMAPHLETFLTEHMGKGIQPQTRFEIQQSVTEQFNSLESTDDAVTSLKQTIFQLACQQLIMASAQERQLALAWISRTYREAVWAFVRQKMPAGQAEDLTNQVLVIYLEQLLDHKVAIHPQTQAYLIGIAQNLIRKYYRKEAIQHRHQAGIEQVYESQVDEEAQFYTREIQTAIQQLLSHLGDKCQRILRMWMMRFSMDEIAATLGFNSEAVARTSKRRCMKQLMKQLEDLPDLYRTLQELR